MIAPCRDCPNKGCGAYHSECEKYLEFRKNRDTENDMRVKSHINTSRVRMYRKSRKFD